MNSLLRRVIAESMHSVMQGDSVPPGVFTVTAVRCGRDLRDATVSVSVFGDDALKEKAMARLSRKAPRFQQIINREVRMKFTPRLVFKLDRSLEAGDETIALLDRLSAGAGEDNANGESDKA